MEKKQQRSQGRQEQQKNEYKRQIPFCDWLGN